MRVHFLVALVAHREMTRGLCAETRNRPFVGHKLRRIGGIGYQGILDARSEPPDDGLFGAIGSDTVEMNSAAMYEGQQR